MTLTQLTSQDENLTQQFEKRFKINLFRKHLQPLAFKDDRRRKLTEEDIINIIDKNKNGNSIQTLADKYGVCYGCVYKWVNYDKLRYKKGDPQGGRGGVWNKERRQLSHNKCYSENKDKYRIKYKDKYHEDKDYQLKRLEQNRKWLKLHPEQKKRMDKERYIKIINDPIKKIEYRKANRIRVAKWKKSEKGKDYIKLYRQTQKYKDYHKEWKKRHYNSGVLLKKEVIK